MYVSENQRPRVALVTGAAGGLGRGIAARLASDGFRLALTDLVSCESLATTLGEAVVFHSPCDLASPESTAGFVSDLLSAMNVDVIINNAALMTPTPLADLTVEKFALFNRINVEAPFQLCQGLAQQMIGRGWGRIVNIVSGTAWLPVPTFTGYVTSKMGLIGLTRGLSREYGGTGVTVNAIMPALTRHQGNHDAMPDEFWSSIQAGQAIKRSATPADLAGGIAFLLSDDAAFMTGQTLSLDGGQILL